MTGFRPVGPHDDALLAAVAPSDWKNPTPAARYDLLVVGAGTGGLVAAAVAAGLGARVALVERERMGGDCLNVGCVPSKALLAAARQVARARRAAAFGLRPAADARPDLGAALERMRAIRAGIAPHDSAHRFRDELGVDVFFGAARFVAPDAAEVAGRRLRFGRAVVASGGRPAVPPVPGLAEAGVLTNESVFSLEKDPGRLAVIGAGPVGCELAQAFARFGSDVVLLETAEQVLPREDADAAAIVAAALARDGVRVVLGARIESVARAGGAHEIRLVGADGARTPIACDAILVAAGRVPNVEDLGLRAAGVVFDPRRGIGIDDFLRTTNRRIFAVGDCALDWKFTHAADAAAKIAVRNALFFGRARLSKQTIPWCTFTDPELARIGLSVREARERGVAVDTWTVPLEANDRARCEGETEGFVRIHTARGRDRIVGATIVAADAGELLAPLAVAMRAGAGLGALADVVLPYPTRAEALKSAAYRYQRTRLTPLVARVLRRIARLPR